MSARPDRASATEDGNARVPSTRTVAVWAFVATSVALAVVATGLALWKLKLVVALLFLAFTIAAAMGFPFVEPDAITPEVRTVARIAADLGGQALERAGLYELERSSREALDRILAVAPRFQQDASPEGVAISICAEARRAFGCDVVQIWNPIDDRQFEVTWRDPPRDQPTPADSSD